MVDDSNRLDRRSVLKALGTTAAVGTGLAASTGSAAAQVARTYGDESSLRAAFEAHGGDLRDTLVAEGIVSEDFAFGDLSFSIDPDATGLAPTAEDGLASVGVSSGNGPTSALGVVSTSSDTHDISLYVQPQRGEAYARVVPQDGGDTLKVSGDGVTPEGCEYTKCVDDGDCTSSYCYTKKEYYSCDSSCNNCSQYDWDCSCYVC
jgi:hypothetical protein